MQRQQRLRSIVPFWLMAAIFVTTLLASLQVLAGFQVLGQAEASFSYAPRSWFARRLSDEHPPDRNQLQTRRKCYPPKNGQPDQRVCVFEDLVLFNGQLYYVTNNASETVPPVKISWLKKFEGDDFLKVAVVNQSQLGFQWDTAQVEELPAVGLVHQQHYSNFYHMFSEIAPSVHYVLCKYLGDCTYSASSGTRVLFIQEKPPNIPTYLMLDSITDTFKCLSPHPVWHKDDPDLRDKVFILRRAVAGVGNEARAFHNWEEEYRKNYHEPPKREMAMWRQRMADCFGFNFTQMEAPTDTLRILFINRHYEEGRMILNQAKLAHLMEKMAELKAFPNYEIKLHYLNGDDSLRDQAAIFANASLLIWPHGATMALTTFLPRGAQAIEVIPWVQDDKAKLPEWVQAIRDTFSLDITLYAVQNRERKRVMFNQDGLLDYGEYQRATPDQKIALLERGECPPGVDGFTCPFWWNHWKVSLNLDWGLLEPTLKQALGKLQELRQAGGVARGGPGDAAVELQLGGGEPAQLPAPEEDAHNRSLTELTAEQQQAVAASSGALTPQAAELLSAAGRATAAGVPLSSHACLVDDGKAEHRLCVFNNLVAHEGKLYYVTEETNPGIPEIQLSWEEWDLEPGLQEDKVFTPAVVSPAQLPFQWNGAQVETVERAYLPHMVDSGNFYHLISEVMPTYFANWCTYLGICEFSQRHGFEIIFIQPDPRRRFGLSRPLVEAWQCFSQRPFRKLIDIHGQPVLVKHGVVGIGPHMRAYERQEFRAKWEDPPAGVMTQWRRFLSECTGTGFTEAEAPKDTLRITFVNRPWSAGRSFINLPEVLWWLNDWLPQQNLPRPHEVATATVNDRQSLAEQIEVFKRTSLLVYPHGATMAHAIFLPKGAVALEVIPWPNVSEPHGWLQSIKQQYELEGLRLLLMVNEFRANLVLNWHALAQDPDWRGLTAEEKVALQEQGTCPKAHEPKCFFNWLHWRSELVVDLGQLAGKLSEALALLQQPLGAAGQGAVATTA